MPRVQVVIQVLDDERSRVARSSFSIGENATRVLLEEVSPGELSRDLMEIFITSLREQYPILDLGGLRVTTSEIDPNGRITGSHEIHGVRRGPDPTPEVSMGTRVVDPPLAAHHFENLSQVLAPLDESNPVSRRIREALRAVVDLRRLSQLSLPGGLSRQHVLELLGVDPQVAEEELERQLQTPDPPRGRTALGAVLDDAQFDFASDQHLPQEAQSQQDNAIDHFRDLGETFASSFREQYPNIGVETLHVEPRLELSESLRESLYRRLTPLTQLPVNPETRATIQREIETFIAEYPNAQVELSGVDFAGTGGRLLSPEQFPEVSMGAARMVEPLEPNFEELSQVPAPPDESSSLARRLREAFRATIEYPQIHRHLSNALSSSLEEHRRIPWESLGLTEDSTQGELVGTLSQLDQTRSPDLDLWERPSPTPIFDNEDFADLVRQQETAYVETQTPGTEPPPRRSFPLKPRAGKEPPMPENRTGIPTRYCRKPVI